MQWIVVHNNHSGEFPICSTVGEKIFCNKVKAETLMSKIQKKYPSIKILRFSPMGSQVDVPFEINADEFEKEFDCKLY